MPQQEQWNTWNETHNIRKKNNFFPGGFVGSSEYVDGYESTVFAKEDVYVYSNGFNYQTYQERYKYHCKGNVDAPWFAPVSENGEFGIFAPSGKISSCRFYAPSFRTVQRTHKARYIFPTQWLNNSTRCSYRCKHYIHRDRKLDKFYWGRCYNLC